MTNPAMGVHETRLWRYLEQHHPDHAARAETLIRRMTPRLDSVTRVFPTYTRHDAIHSLEVVRRMVQVLHPACFDPGSSRALSAAEAYLLLAAAFTHDVGMAVLPGEQNHLQPSPTLVSWLRTHHAERGSTYVLSEALAPAIPPGLARPLAQLIRAHNLPTHKLEGYLGRGSRELPVDLAQLGAIFCIADALEFSAVRVPDGAIERLKGDPSPAGRRSYCENRTYRCLGDRVTVQPDGQVRCAAWFDDPDVAVNARTTIRNAEHWLRQYGALEARSWAAGRLRIRTDSIATCFEGAAGSG